MHLAVQITSQQSLSDIITMSEQPEVIMGKVVLHDRPPGLERKLVRLDVKNSGIQRKLF